MIKRFSTTRKGFTLIELLVSIAIFVVFLGVVSMSYIGIVRSQRQANEVRKMYSDVRTFTESLSEDMRLGTIDYDCYPDPATSTTANCPPFSAQISTSSSEAQQSPYLSIVNKDRTEKIIYWFDKDNGKVKVIRYKNINTDDSIDIPQWSVEEGYPPESVALLSDMVKVRNLTFSVNPPVNPYSSANYAKNQYQFQPKVTLTLSVENANKNIPPFHMDFQTTLSSRVYSRANS